MHLPAGARIAVLAAVALAVVAGVSALVGGDRGSIEEARPTIGSDDRLLLRSAEPAADQAARTLRGLGVDWVLVPAVWARLAPASARALADPSDPAAYPHAAWAALDRALRLSKRHGLGTMIELTGPAPVARPLIVIVMLDVKFAPGPPAAVTAPSGSVAAPLS